MKTKKVNTFTEKEVLNLIKIAFFTKHDGTSFVTFRHFRRKSGAVTACCVVERNEADTFTMRVGFGFCSPEDQFSRKEGRKAAMKRLFSHLVVFDDIDKIASTLIKYMKACGDDAGDGMLTLVGDYNNKGKTRKFDEWFKYFAEEL